MPLKYRVHGMSHHWYILYKIPSVLEMFMEMFMSMECFVLDVPKQPTVYKMLYLLTVQTNKKKIKTLTKTYSQKTHRWLKLQ